MLTRRSLPIASPAGPRIRAPSRKKNGIWTWRMVMLLIVTSSSSPPSTVSSASPRQYSKTMLEMAMLRNPPLDSVPNLIRPVRLNGPVLNVPSYSVPRSYPLTMQLSMVTFSVARTSLSAYELFSTIASSLGELTVVLEIRTFLQQSTLIPSRLVSITRPSMRKLSTPVGRMQKWPPLSIVMSRMATLRHCFRAIALLPCNGADSSLPPRTSPRPSMVPGPEMVMLVRPSPQIRLLCQWLCP
jgi:hypothetical protein